MAMRFRVAPIVGWVCVLGACVLLSPVDAAAEEATDEPGRTEVEATDDLEAELEALLDDALGEEAPGDDTSREPGSAEVAEDPAEGDEKPEAILGDEPAEIVLERDATKIDLEDEDVEVILVMANKRAESLQDVPISMVALDGGYLEKAGVTDFSEIQKFVPNLSIEGGTDTRSTSVRIRGIGSVGTNAGVDPSVGLFIDGVYQGRAGMSMGDLGDIEAVEVLRGPQGTLYGKNTAAGLISIRTLRPSYDYSATAEFVGGNENTLEGRGSLNVPVIGDRIATRISGYRSLRDGWDTNIYDGDDVNDADKWGIRNKWLFDVSDQVSLLLAGDYGKEDTKCCVSDIITYKGDSLLWDGFNPPRNPNVNLNPNWDKLGGFFNPDGPNFNGNLVDPAKPELRNFRDFDGKVDVDRSPENEVEIWGVQADLDLELGDWDVNWLTAYRAYNTDSQFDGDFSYFNAVIADTREDLDQVSTELRLQSPLGGLVDFTTGLYFFYMDHDTVGHIGFEQDFADIFIGPNYEPIINNDRSQHRTYSYAGYGQFNLNFSELFRFTGGLRLSHERKTLDGSQVSTSELPAPPVAGPPDFRDEERDSTNVSGTARLQYFPTEDMMFYASFASGFKSGGFNQLRTAQEVSPEFDDETAYSYEAGFRSAWLEGLLTFNATGFFTDYEDFQAQSFTGTAIAIRNAGSFYSYGLESDMVVTPIENLMWRTSLGFNITEYQDFDQAENTVENIVDLGAEYGVAPFRFAALVQDRIDNPDDPFNPVPAGVTTAQDLKGERLDNAPRWSVSTSLDYTWPIVDLPLNWVFHADYSFRSSLFLNQDLDRNLKEDPLHLVAFRTGIQQEDSRWELLFWMRNVFDEEYMVAGFDVPVLGGFAGLHGPPRHYGGTFRVRF
jgi:iron complex outermembrane receptor protein